jgi:hypothetical protein
MNKSSRYNIKNWCGEVLEKFQNSTRARDRRAQPQTGVRICIVKLDIVRVFIQVSCTLNPLLFGIGTKSNYHLQRAKMERERKTKILYNDCEMNFRMDNFIPEAC